MVPNTSGTRLSLGSKSSVAPVDCQTYSATRSPHLTLPVSARRLTQDAGCRARTHGPRRCRVSRSRRFSRDHDAGPAPAPVTQRAFGGLMPQHKRAVGADGRKLLSRGDGATEDAGALRSSHMRLLDQRLGPSGGAARNQLVTSPFEVPTTRSFRRSGTRSR